LLPLLLKSDLRHAKRTLVAAVVIGAALGVATGCKPSDPPAYRVSGAVAFDGKLVSKGFINFLSPNRSEGAATAKIEDGRYDAQVRPGARRVEILATEDAGPVDPVMGQAPQRQYIPEKYNVDTILEIDVAESDNTQDFNLKP
jgi:hypothetical protein